MGGLIEAVAVSIKLMTSTARWLYRPWLGRVPDRPQQGRLESAADDSVPSVILVACRLSIRACRLVLTLIAAPPIRQDTLLGLCGADDRYRWIGLQACGWLLAITQGGFTGLLCSAVIGARAT